MRDQRDAKVLPGQNKRMTEMENAIGKRVFDSGKTAESTDCICMSSYTAQNIGAGRYDRVRKGYRMGYAIVFSFAAIGSSP